VYKLTFNPFTGQFDYIYVQSSSVDGGKANAVYLPEQSFDGGGANG